MKVELLHTEGCLSTPECLLRLEAVLRDLAPGTEASDVLVTTPEQARAIGFQGSPSIRVNGVDLEDRAQESTGLT